MTQSQRRAFKATNPVQKLTKEFDQAWQGASQAAYHGLEGLEDVANYTTNNPFEAMAEVGDFALDAAETVWDGLRDVYGNGLTWWNTIERVIETPCEDKWWVIIETALPAAAETMWLFLVPSPDEVLEEYLNPKGAGHSRRRRRDSDPDSRKRSPSGRKRRSWPVIPDIDSMIANSLPGSHAVQARDAGFAKRFFFDAIDVVDRGLWYWLLVDATDTFLTVWTSGMREAKFCSQQWEHLGFGSYGSCESGGPNFKNLCDEFTADVKKNTNVTAGAVEFIDAEGNMIPAAGEVFANRSITYVDGPTDSYDLWIRWTFFFPDGTYEERDSEKIPISKGETINLSDNQAFTNVERLTYGVQNDPSGLRGTDWTNGEGMIRAFGQ